MSRGAVLELDAPSSKKAKAVLAHFLNFKFEDFIKIKNDSKCSGAFYIYPMKPGLPNMMAL
jgi:hypothetical protein